MFMRTWEMIQDTQDRKKQSSSFQITLSRYEGWANKAEEKMDSLKKCN